MGRRAGQEKRGWLALTPVAYIGGRRSWLVMPARVAGIHVLKPFVSKDVDGRDNPGHDDGGS
jgi:hypothetical protein